MVRPASQHPTELELEILKIVWKEGELSVREVREILSSYRELAHTSVITIMNIMVGKGYLERTKTGRGYVYRARITEQETTHGMLKDLVKRAFSGSPAAALLGLLSVDDLDADQLQELRRLIQKKIKESER
jgi:predicted transcriptional regulator